MKKQILILECGKGFGGALTSLKSFLDEIHDPSEFEFHLLTNYPQTLIAEKGAIKYTGILKRHKLYGPESRLERNLSRFFPKHSGHMAFLLDMVFSGCFYAIRVFIYIVGHQIDIVHLNNSILINDYGMIAGICAGKRVIAQVRAPEYPSKISRFLSSMIHHFLPVSKFVKHSLQVLGVEEEKITILPEGIDGQEFDGLADRPLPPGMPKQNAVPVIGMIGCLVPWKGHEVFLKACQIILKQVNAEFLVIGDTPDGDPGYKNFLMEYAVNLGISESVHFLGHCANVAPFIKKSDIMIHASIEPEPFGRVVLEAMSLGKPVIATAAGGPGEVISNGIDGILVTPGNANSMADAVLKLIQNKMLRSKIGAFARIKVKDQYSSARHAAIILNTYKSVKR